MKPARVCLALAGVVNRHDTCTGAVRLPSHMATRCREGAGRRGIPKIMAKTMMIRYGHNADLRIHDEFSASYREQATEEEAA